MLPDKEYTIGIEFDAEEAHLREILERQDLSQLAREIVEEEIQEYRAIEAARGHFKQCQYTKGKSTLLHPFGDGKVEAGKELVLSHQFGELEEGEELAEPTDLGTVSISFDSRKVKMKYLGVFRNQLIDVHGRSRPARFLIEIPEDQRGRQGWMDVDVFVGNNWVRQVNYKFEVESKHD